MNDKQTEDFLKKFGVKVKAGKPEFKKHFADDEYPRYVFPVTISRGRRRMTISFGQSYADGRKPPSAYEVLAAMVKSDPGDFEWFCRMYGCNPDSRKDEKTWKACTAEWAKTLRVLEDDDCLRAFQEIT